MLYLGPYRSLGSSVNGGGEYRGSFTGDLKTMIGYGLPLYMFLSCFYWWSNIG
jgi:hypothetical protein